MKLVRCGLPGDERLGFVDADDILRDLSGHVEDIDGRMFDDTHLAQLRNLDSTTLPKIDPQTRHALYIANLGKFLCIKLNPIIMPCEIGFPIPANLI